MRTGCSALLLSLSILAGSLYANTYYVDDDAHGTRGDGTAAHPFDEVQEAVDAAVNGDTVIVAPGRYLSPDPWVYAELKLKGKSIRLVSSAPTDFSVAQETILCGVVIFQSDEDPNCLLQGFKIQNHTGGGILGNRTKASVSHCILSGNGPCGGTVLKDIRGKVSNCLIVDNATFHGCVLGPVVSGCYQLFNCTIANNLSGVSILPENPMDIRTLIRVHNCIIYGNRGTQIAYRPTPDLSWPTSLPGMIDYCLIQGWTSDMETINGLSTTTVDGDPCFVQPGYWEGGALVEGDYHLKSEGYRWSERSIHGTHWFFDFQTSCAIDAGDPMDSLAEEPERGPDDPEGRWGVNHAIDIGAYGGTSQASLAPNPGKPLGIAGVDLRDYLPLAAGNQWSTSVPGRTTRAIVVTYHGLIRWYHGNAVDTFDVTEFQDSSSGQQQIVSWVFADDTLSAMEGSLNSIKLPVALEQLEVIYPQIVTVGSTIEAPADLFRKQADPLKSALVMRGTLAQVLAGTQYDPNQFIDSKDVIAIREKTAEGAAGEPIALFARGLGLFLLDGQPVTSIRIGNIVYTPGTAPTSPGTTTRKR